MLCVPIIENNIDDAIINAEKVLDIVDIVEFRVDYFDKIKKRDIVKMCKYPSIITIRAQWEGGSYNGDLDRRINLYKIAIKNNVKYIDIELNEKRNIELVEYRNNINSDTKIIISYHNFKHIPLYNELLNIVICELMIGDIGKFATMVNSYNDNLTILNIIEEYKNNVIGIGMGDKGKITRILGNYIGNVLTFVSFNNKKSAPGQLDINEIYGEINEYS